MAHIGSNKDRPSDIYDSPTFEQDLRIHLNESVGSASISPSGRDVVLASQHGLHIIDLDAPYSPPRHLRHDTPWTPADVQWSPFSSRYYWVVSTSNQRALVWNLELAGSQAPIEHVLHAHARAITDINFSAHHPDVLATCSIDSFVHSWDLRTPSRPVISFSDWFAGATQVKWNRQDPHIVASAHDRFLRIWDDRKGAIPLVTIEAHTTKIYGVDWNRTSPTKLITCSLDRTIKIWDYAVSDVLPKRIIRTPYPVWRARHTPFGWGVLAMPQRGNDKLHLFHRRMDESTPWDAEVEPVHSFKGHSDQVKEFLWRTRGTIDDGHDHRDFQLVSWGSDRELILHRMRERHLQPVGFEKGMVLDKSFALTRRGSPYKSFRDPPEKSQDLSRSLLGGLAEYNTGSQNDLTPAMSRAPIPMARSWVDSASTGMQSQMQARNARKDNTNLLDWMKGVRIGKRSQGMNDRRRSRPSFIGDTRAKSLKALSENLKDEIIHAGERYPKVTFQEADIGLRQIKIAFNAPRPDKSSVYLELRAGFPRDYPEGNSPEFRFERITSISEDEYIALEAALHRIAEVYSSFHLGCLEAAFGFLLGEQDVEQTVGWLLAMEDGADAGDEKAESSSDEEDGLGDLAAQSQTLDTDGAPVTAILSSDAKVPLPKGCGALWAPNGKLICFFPPKDEPASLLQDILASESRGKGDHFEGFGRLHLDSSGPGNKHKIGDKIEEEAVEDSDWSASSSSSSSGSEDVRSFPSRFYPPKAWHGASMRFQKLRSHSTDGSHRTSGGLQRVSSAAKQKTIVSIHDMDSILPAKPVLGREYAICGDSLLVASTNAAVAQRQGYSDLADIWELIKLILTAEVPLTPWHAHAQREDIFVLARRALVSIRRSDSGLDVSFDEPEHVANPPFTSHVKWGGHPFGSEWLVNAMFEHFERICDVQMLAMLSCVFAEPAMPPVGAPGHIVDYLQIDPSLRWPALSVPYLPSEEIAMTVQGPIISVSASPQQSHPSLSVYGSGSSSELPREMMGNSEPTTPFSTASSPPLAMSKDGTQRSSASQSMSTSPEQRISVPSGASGFASSVWSRPFQLSNSPPTRGKRPGEGSLSTSQPTSGVTWGGTTFHGHSTGPRRSLQWQELSDDNVSSAGDDVAAPGEAAVKVTLKNQLMFDEEAHVSRHFLDDKASARYINYRDMYAHLLDSWGLALQRSELVKFDEQSPKPLTSRDSQTTLTLGRAEALSKSTQTSTLSVIRRCTACGRNQSKQGARCEACGSRMRILTCVYCLQPISALHKLCEHCGHASHMSCVHQYLTDLDHGEQIYCRAGCGCLCGELEIEDLITVKGLPPPPDMTLDYV